MQERERDNGTWWPVAEWLLAIAAGTSVPVPEGIAAPRMAKVVHFIGSSIFAFVTFRAFRKSLRLNRIASAFGSGIIGGLALTLSEARQSVNPSRMSLLSDAIANLLGVISGGVAAAVVEDRE